jgi:hypothetical protein
MRHVLIVVSSLVLVLGGLHLARPWLAAKQVEASERQAIVDLLEFQTAEVDFASGMNLGGFVAPDILANPRRYPKLGAVFLHPIFLMDVRYGYRFEFQGEPPSQYDAGRHPIRPSYGVFVYVARPLVPGRTGARTFAVSSYNYGVFARTDNQVPGTGDERVDIDVDE